MTKRTHTIYIGLMASITILVTAYLSYVGYSYYITPIEERFYHPQHTWFKPSGPFGHGLGIVGTLMVVVGVFLYIARKRYNFLSKYIRLKYLLEFHIFLCVLGPIMILFHTAFKFGGIVSVAFWSMVLVVASGVIGRFIYIQIPRTIEGRELTLNEVKNMKDELSDILRNKTELNEQLIPIISGSSDHENPAFAGSSFIFKYFEDRKTIGTVRRTLKRNGIARTERKSIIELIWKEISLANRISRLQTMQKLFKYWHVAHLPFALIMLIVLIIHVAVTLAFGYKWIF